MSMPPSDMRDEVAAALAHAEAHEHGHTHGAELLTPIEMALVAQLGQCSVLYAQDVVGDGPTRQQDIGEFIARIHDLQARVMMQAAARAYPARFRLAGGTLEAP